MRIDIRPAAETDMAEIADVCGSVPLDTCGAEPAMVHNGSYMKEKRNEHLERVHIKT